MRTLPAMMIRALAPFAPLFSKSVFQHVQVLVAGAILAPGCRTVSSALRAMGLDQHKRFHRYHRVLSRARWSSREVGRVLLGLLVEAFVCEGEPLVVGIDETLERRYGKKISARGIYRYLRCALPTSISSRAASSKVGVRNAIGRDPLGFEGLGLALPFCSGSFRALCRQAR